MAWALLPAPWTNTLKATTPHSAALTTPALSLPTGPPLALSNPLALVQTPQTPPPTRTPKPWGARTSSRTGPVGPSKVSPALALMAPALAPPPLVAPEEALLLSTRTSFTSCGPRLWPIRCWPGGSHYRTTSRWLSRGRGPWGAAQGCRVQGQGRGDWGSPCPAWLLEVLEVWGQDKDQEDPWARATAELTG